jgi:hypothetical protein
MRAVTSLLTGLAAAAILVLAEPFAGNGSNALAEVGDYKVKYILTTQEPGYKCEECCEPMYLCCTLPLQGECE